MTFRLSLLLLSSSLLPITGQEELLPLSPTKEEEKEDARFKIPLGAVISDVTLPYFGKNRRRISLLTAKEMRVEGADPELNPELDASEVQRLNGKDLKLWLYDKEGAISSIATIPQAKYLVDEKQLITSGDLIMRGADNNFQVRSDGAIFTLKTGQVLLLGPGTTRFTFPEKNETTMNMSPLLPLAAAIQMLVAAPPEIDPEHLENFERAVAPKQIPQIDADEKFAAAQLNDAALAKRVAEYLLKVGKTELLTQIADPPVKEPDPFDEPFELGPSGISIDFDKGAYFDSEAREIAYFGNIKIEGRGIKMTCNKDLKAIFNPPIEKKGKTADSKKDASPLKSSQGFGDLKQASANGRIRLEFVDKDGEKYNLRGDRALFQSDPNNPQKEGVITLRGDNLSFIKGDPRNNETAIRGDSTTKDAWVIVNIKEGLDPTKTDLTMQFSEGNFKIAIISPKKK